MIRSFHYAAGTAFLDEARVRPEDRAIAEPWADAWHRWVSAAFLRSYVDCTAGAPFLPAADDFGRMLGTQIVGRSLIELAGELGAPTAPTVAIPLACLAELAGV
jgi:maltose alpha-D-glucosyltransferase/alpha-amylase